MTDVNKITKKELMALPVRHWMAHSIYDTLLVFSSGQKHNSGWAAMYVVGLIKGVPVEIASNCSDDIEWLGFDFVRTDCAYKSGVMHFWKRGYQFEVGDALSSITIKSIKVQK